MKILKKILLLLLLLFIVAVIVVGVKIYYDLSEANILDTKEKTEILTFENGKKIYIRAKVWGVAGNHEEVVFSENPITVPDKERDYIFYTNEVVYKIENNSLRLYACDCDASMPTIIFKDIQVILKDLKTADEIRDYNTNYQKYGLERISVYE